jgi:hypothetical protein
LSRLELRRELLSAREDGRVVSAVITTTGGVMER